MTIYISEVFGAGLSHKGALHKANKPTIQGEGKDTGRATIFVRFFGCTLRCEGFSQPNPLDPSTYLPTIVQTVDPKSIKRLEDFKTPQVGCDTAYAVYPQFKHLRTDYTSAAELYHDAIEPLLYRDKCGNPTWEHPVTGNTIDICFTGGEPMMHQDSIVEILSYINAKVSLFSTGINASIETNATKELSTALSELPDTLSKVNVSFNISPKLHSVSGETAAKAWHPEIILEYLSYFDGCLKFVVNDTAECWNELNLRVQELNLSKCNQQRWTSAVPVYVMPAGAVYHQQTDQEYIRTISERALEEGYYISPRLHVNIWDGCVGC